MTATLFTEFPGLTARERSIAELVARLALHADVQLDLATSLGLGEADLRKMKEAVGGFEKNLTQQNPTLSSLLASTSKSKCCS